MSVDVGKILIIYYKELKKMTKKELMKALEGLDDDAIIYISIPDEVCTGIATTNFYAPEEYKVVGDDVENEITLVIED